MTRKLSHHRHFVDKQNRGFAVVTTRDVCTTYNAFFTFDSAVIPSSSETFIVIYVMTIHPAYSTLTQCNPLNQNKQTCTSPTVEIKLTCSCNNGATRRSSTTAALSCNFKGVASRDHQSTCSVCSIICSGDRYIQ